MIGMYWSSIGASAVNRSPIVSMLPPIDPSPPSTAERAIVMATAIANRAAIHTSCR